MYCLELLQLVSIIVSLIYVILPFVMMGHVSIVCSARIEIDLRNKSSVAPTIWSLWRSMKTFWNSKGRPFPLFFWGSLRLLPRYVLKALILLEEDCIKSKTATQCMCFARGAVLNGKTDLELKVPIWQPYPRKHCARCKQLMRAEKIFPCVRILTLITPLPLAPYIRIYRNPDSAIRENFACAFWNPVYSTTNPESY